MLHLLRLQKSSIYLRWILTLILTKRKVEDKEHLKLRSCLVKTGSVLFCTQKNLHQGDALVNY